MFEHREIETLEDFFCNLNDRKNKGVYFYRINGYNSEIEQFIRRYYETARTSGVVVEGKIPNPDEKNLSYYSEIMGMDFQMSPGFFGDRLKKWLPRMGVSQRTQMANALYDVLDDMRRSGKNENMLKNAYIKLMCWLYYKFERIVNCLGANQIPKILYEGEVSKYELMLLSVLSNTGCDVVLLQYRGDGEYGKLDPEGKYSVEWKAPGMGSFPAGYSLKQVAQIVSAQSVSQAERIPVKQPSKQASRGTTPISYIPRQNQEIPEPCTNAWITGKGLDDVRTAPAIRGTDSRFFYNCFLRIQGVEDKLTYLNELYQFQLELKNSGRKVLILDGRIPPPEPEEIGQIQRKNYQSKEQMIADLAINLNRILSLGLQMIGRKAFIDLLMEEGQLPGMNVNRLTNKAVYLLCWLKRYQGILFPGWKMPQIGCFLFMGNCKSENEALFLRFLAKLPADVVLFNPNRNNSCCLKDPKLYEINYTESLVVEHFPRENGSVQVGTAAYHAERELDQLMYQDSGIYRNQQYQKANSLSLQTMYEEISLLWKEEVKYRPNFSTVQDTVNIPVIFAKVSGVKDGQLLPYWNSIRNLVTEDTLLIRKAPYLSSTDVNPMRSHSVEFLKNGKLQRERIKANRDYPYGVLREEVQDHMLDKLQLLIDRRLIKGTFENGTEYTIVAVVLNLKKELVRMIQKFDFTKKNPKLIYINTGEKAISLEDSILAAYLNLIGFDVLFFVPTGYQSVENHFNGKLMEEHQIGTYLYDLTVPDFGKLPSATRPTWRDKIFKRGT